MQVYGMHWAGVHAHSKKNLVEVETKTACDRIHLVLTGTPVRSPLTCLLCITDAIDDNTHVKTCPATAQHRILRFLRMVLRMAEVMASVGDSLQHDPSLRPSASASRNVDAKHLLSDIHVAPFHERTPIHTLPQTIIPPHDQDTARRFGVWDCGPGDWLFRSCRSTVKKTVPMTTLATMTTTCMMRQTAAQT